MRQDSFERFCVHIRQGDAMCKSIVGGANLAMYATETMLESFRLNVVRLHGVSLWACNGYRPTVEYH